MSDIDVIRETINYEELLREGETNHVLKGEHLIRDSQYPDIKDVLGADVKATITSKEVLGDKIMVEGKIEYIVFYVSKEEPVEDSPYNKVHAVIFNDKFANYIELNNDEHNIVCNVECDIEHIEADLLNERKVGISGILILRWGIYKNGEFEYVKDIDGTEDIQVQREEEPINKLKGEKDLDLMGKSRLKASIDKSEIDEVLKCDMNLHKKEIKVVDGKVYIGCYCRIMLLYKGKNNRELESLVDDVYLSKEEEIPGISGDMLTDMDLKVYDQQYSVNLDDVGENRVVEIEFIVKGKVKIYSKERVEILKDAYSPTMNIDLESGKTEFALIHDMASSEVTAKETLELKNKEDRVEEVIFVTGRPMIKEKVIDDERVRLEGVVKTYVLYKLASEEMDYGILVDNVPFSTVVDVKGLRKNMKVVAKASLENIDASIEGNAISIRANVNISLKAYYRVNKDYIKEVMKGNSEVKEKQASIIIYIVSDGDTLWKLAKRYNTTVSELERLNELEDVNNIKAGDKLIIPGRATF